LEAAVKECKEARIKLERDVAIEKFGLFRI
jgi:hypothetical protein